MRILVVEDEDRYRTTLCDHLERLGHDVTAVASGTEAVARGLHWRPEVLIADWMLGNPLHGLHVCEVLGAIDADLRTLLVTGYSTPDLIDDARRAGASDVLAKPFRIAALEAAIARATEAAPAPRAAPPFAVLEVEVLAGTAGDAGTVRVRRANAAGRALLHDAATLEALLGPGARAALEAAHGGWLEVEAAPGGTAQWMRARPLARASGGAARSIVLLVPGARPGLRSDPRVRTLVGDAPPEPSPLGSLSLLVVDPSAGIRKLYVNQLERLGCTCYKADGVDFARRVLLGNPAIEVAVLDHSALQGRVADAVAALRAVRPGLRVVGSSASPQHASAFAEAGVPLFLAKPWLRDRLVDVLGEAGRAPGSAPEGPA